MKAAFREYITKLCDTRERSEQTFIQQTLPQFPPSSSDKEQWANILLLEKRP